MIEKKPGLSSFKLFDFLWHAMASALIVLLPSLKFGMPIWQVALKEIPFVLILALGYLVSAAAAT